MRINQTTLAGMFGNALEWFDFLLYAYFATLFAQLFFPKHDPFVSLILTFSVFAGGFLIRPIGGLVLGYWGDRYGRRKILIITIVTMTIVTTGIAVLPTYAQIGFWSPLLLTVLRLVQGFAVSGELNGATAFLIEHAPQNRRALAGSLAMCSAFIGILTASVLATTVTIVVSKPHLMAWGWRIPFVLAAILGLIGLWLRLRVTETPKFSELTDHDRILHTVFIQYWRPLCRIVFLTSVMGVANYFFIAYFTTFMVKTLQFPLAEAMLINLVSMIGLVILLPLSGLLADKVGRKPVFCAGVIAMLLAAYPVFWLLTLQSWQMVLLAELLFIVCLAPIAGLVPTLLAELFPTAIRNCASSIGYNISLAIFGGTAPLVALLLVKSTAHLMSPAWYLMGCCVLALLAVWPLQEMRQQQLK